MNPNFIIGGIVAGGTSFLSSAITQHPQIYLPKVTRPEPSFFYKSWEYEKGMEYYRNKYFHEIQRLSNEIFNDKSLPNQNYSQSVVKVMQEKIDFFKSNSGTNSIDYNVVSGQLTILNGKRQILCQRNNPKIDLFKEFGVNEEDVQYIRVLLHQTSVQNKEISVQIKATVENKSQMYKMKLHTLWSPMKKDV